MYKYCILEIKDKVSVKLKEFNEQVEKAPNKMLKICVERNDGYNYIYEINIFSNKDKSLDAIEKDVITISEILNTTYFILSEYNL